MVPSLHAAWRRAGGIAVNRGTNVTQKSRLIARRITVRLMDGGDARRSGDDRRGTALTGSPRHERALTMSMSSDRHELENVEIRRTREHELEETNNGRGDRRVIGRNRVECQLAPASRLTDRPPSTSQHAALSSARDVSSVADTHASSGACDNAESACVTAAVRFHDNDTLQMEFCLTLKRTPHFLHGLPIKRNVPAISSFFSKLHDSYCKTLQGSMGGTFLATLQSHT